MTKVLDWNSNRNMWLRVLNQQSDQGIDYWIKQIRIENLKNENELRAWLTDQGITGYAANLLVMEQFGYPDWVIASADELVENQYSDRPHLRPIYDAIISTVSE